MSVQERLENVNEGSLLICFCLFWWIFLVGARADQVLDIPYWAVFTPLWVWKVVVFVGWLTGLIVWLRQRGTYTSSELNTYSFDDPVFPFIQAMSVSALFSLLLCCTEILLCLNLSIPSLDLAYLTVLTPLLLVGLFGIFGFFFLMIDSRSFSWNRRARRDRNQHLRTRPIPGRDPNDPYDPAFVTPRPRRVCTFTLELCIAANLLQLLFLIARLDHWIRSKWVVTFIPTFILLGMKFLFCTVGFIVALIRFFTACFIQLEQRRLPIYYYASHLFIDFLLCTSITLLALRLDGHLTAAQCSYLLICAPVLLSLIIYATGAFCLGPGNPWWFGLNRNVLLALFEACPGLQLCANTSVSAAGLWKHAANGHPTTTTTTSSSAHSNGVRSIGVNSVSAGIYSHVVDDYHTVVPSGCSAESQLECGPPSPSSLVPSPSVHSTAQGGSPAVGTSPVAWTTRPNRVEAAAPNESFPWSDACVPTIPLNSGPAASSTVVLSATPSSSPAHQTESVRHPD